MLALGRREGGQRLRDLDDFTEYVSGNAQRLKRVCYLLTGDDADAQDLLQTALAKLYLRWPKITATGNPDAYVRRVLVTTHRSALRRRWHREVPAAVLADKVDDGATSARADDRLVLQAALMKLTPRQRAVVVLRYYTDLSELDTAAALDCSVGTVKTLASRGLARLRSLLTTGTDDRGKILNLKEGTHGN
jgi:RNA polymerase sigma-70 factor (sigma-E family)